VSTKKPLADRIPAFAGVGGLLIAICCVGVPLILGVTIGATVGIALDLTAGALIVLAVTIWALRRRTSSCENC
jgi:hypothetical protein